MDYKYLQMTYYAQSIKKKDVLTFFTGVRIHGRTQPNFIFFKVKAQNLKTESYSSPLKLPGYKFSQLKYEI